MTVRITIAAILAGLSMSAHAIADTQRIDIPAGSLLTALETLAKQANVDLVYQDAQVKGFRTGSVIGEFSPHDAVMKLLEGTPLKVRRDEASGAILIMVPASLPTASSFPLEGRGIESEGSRSIAHEKKSFWSRLRLAQSDSKDHGEVGTRSPRSGEGRGEATAGEDEREAQSPEVTELEEIVVVGSRLATKADGPSPATIIDRQAIDELGVTSVGDVLKYTPQQSFSFTEAFNVGGERYAQLRGLAAGTTLVLINGRRTVPGAGSISRNVFDLNAIPLSAVERVEVLADSASAVYGADAVGGVVNIVLKSHLDAVQLDLYSGSAEGGAEERRVSVSAGGRTPRAQGLIVLDYFKREPLFGVERDRSSDADYRPLGGLDRRALASNPGNICAASGNLPGLSTPCAAVPAGSTGIGLTPASFLPTAGLENRATLSQQTSIVPESERYGAVALGSYEVADTISAFAELMYTDRRDVQVRNSPIVSNGLVPAANPFNPFGVPVRANFLLTGIGPITNYANEKAYRETLGLRGSLWEWDWELAGIASQSSGDTWTANNVNVTRVNAALAATSPAQALNVFQHGPGGDFALLSSLIADPSTNAISKKSDEVQVGGFVRGQLLDLPPGPLQIVFGAEWRRETMDLVQPSATINIRSGTARRDSSSAYVEGRVPILGDGFGPAVLGRLTATLAARYDYYSDFGGTTNAEYGLEWRPRRSLLVRASYGESYRAPGLFQLFSPRTTLPGTQFSSDPARGGQPFVATFISGGNPNLDPETAEASSVGAVWTPEVFGHPRFSASFWQVEQDQRITTSLSFLTLLANEAFFPERVVREAPSAADAAAGLPGRILSIDTSLLNAGSVDTEGLDLEASAAFETPYGRFSPRLAATRVSSYKAADFPNTPAVQRVGVANTSGSIARWKVVVGLSWNSQGYGATGTVRHTAGYDDTASNNVRNGLRANALTLFDLQASIDLQETLRTSGLLAGTTLRLGVNNVFDKAPPYSDVAARGYDPSQADLRQRFFYASLSKTF